MMRLSLGFPRIHDLSSQVCKVLDVSGRQRRAAGDYYSGDLRVAHVDGSAILLSFGRETRCSFGRRAIKVQYALLQILGQQLLEGQVERFPTSTVGQQH